MLPRPSSPGVDFGVGAASNTLIAVGLYPGSRFPVGRVTRGLFISPPSTLGWRGSEMLSRPLKRGFSWLDLKTPLQYLGFLTRTLATCMFAIAIAASGRHPVVSVVAVVALATFCSIAFGTIVWMSVRHRESLALLGRPKRAAERRANPHLRLDPTSISRDPSAPPPPKRLSRPRATPSTTSVR